MLQNSKRDVRSRRRHLTELSEKGEDLALHVAEFAGTVEDLATRFGLTTKEISNRIEMGRIRGLICQKQESRAAGEPDSKSELLQAVGFDYESIRPGQPVKVAPRLGRDVVYKKTEAHRRAVASVAAALGATHAELNGEVGIRLRGCDSHGRYQYELRMRTEGKYVRHCPDLVVCLEREGKSLAAVVEVLVEPRSEEELMSICTGWRKHVKVAEIHFYATAETIGALKSAVRRTDTQQITTVYTLPARLKASMLLDLKPNVQADIDAAVRVQSNGPTLSENEELKLLEILQWIGAWRAAGVWAIAANFELTSEVTLGLLKIGCDRELIDQKRLHQEGPVYHLTTKGAERVGIKNEFRILRRNISYLKMRANVAAIFSKQAHGPEDKVLNPSDLGAKAPTVQVNSGAIIRPSPADVLLRSCREQGELIAAVLVTDYQSLSVSESLCNAWYSNTDVSSIIFYTMTDGLADLQQVIKDADLGRKLKAVPAPSDRMNEQSKREEEDRLRAERKLELQQRQLANHEARKSGEENYDDQCRYWAQRRESARRHWKELLEPFREITDEEWRAIEPILLTASPPKPRHWYRIPTNRDRDVINTLLLCEHLQRELRDMTLTDGYVSGAICRDRMDQWQNAGVWILAWTMLMRFRLIKGVNQSLHPQKKTVAPILAKGIFGNSDYKKVLEHDLTCWEEMGGVKPA